MNHFYWNILDKSVNELFKTRCWRRGEKELDERQWVHQGYIQWWAELIKGEIAKWRWFGHRNLNLAALNLPCPYLVLFHFNSCWVLTNEPQFENSSSCFFFLLMSKWSLAWKIEEKWTGDICLLFHTLNLLIVFSKGLTFFSFCEWAVWGKNLTNFRVLFLYAVTSFKLCCIPRVWFCYLLIKNQYKNRLNRRRRVRRRNHRSLWVASLGLRSLVAVLGRSILIKFTTGDPIEGLETVKKKKREEQIMIERYKNRRTQGRYKIIIQA